MVGKEETIHLLKYNLYVYIIHNLWYLSFAFNLTYKNIYNVNVYAEDESNATTDNSSFKILIDAYFVGDIGFSLDNNSDGIYDSFNINETIIIFL